jgi:hypothetical protein
LLGIWPAKYPAAATSYRPETEEQQLARRKSLLASYASVRLLRTLWAASLFWAAVGRAIAEDIGGFYRANAIVTGTDMRQRPWGFARGLREVLLKVSGDPRLKVRGIVLLASGRGAPD